jgi:hypothetical protein
MSRFWSFVMRKISKLLTVAGGAALLLGLASAEGSAQNSHWFYGNYGHYDGMTWGLFPPPPPPPAYPAARHYEDPYAEPAPVNRPPRQRHAYQPPATDPAIDPAIEAEPGTRPNGSQPMAPKKPKSATSALGAESDDVTTGSTDNAQPGQGAVSCDKARGIVADYGFRDIKADSCSGKTYGFSATRDGKSFSIKIVAANGELAEVRRQ